MRKNFTKNMKEWLEEIGFAVEVDLHDDLTASVPHTGQGDYIGGAVEASNRDAMCEEYPGLLTTRGSGYGWREAILLDPQQFRTAYHWENHKLHDKAVSLAEAVGALHDYPCYDDEHLSNFEEELISKEIPEKIGELLRNVDEDLIPVVELEKKLEECLRDPSGARCPEIETGLRIYFPNEKEAKKLVAAHVEAWEKGAKERLFGDDVLPWRDINGAAAIDAVQTIRDILATVKFSFEAPPALREVARLLGHPGADE